jgi:hypothetical protein
MGQLRTSPLRYPEKRLAYQYCTGHAIERDLEADELCTRLSMMEETSVIIPDTDLERARARSALSIKKTDIVLRDKGMASITLKLQE